MPTEPPVKRAVAFIDGQNLFYAAKDAFGHRYPNYDVVALAQAICGRQSWALTRTCFYSGIPSATDNAFWHHFWNAKLSAMGRQGVHVFSRPLRYRVQSIQVPGGGTQSITVGQEKGIDIRIALDVVSSIRRQACDVAVVFSQDQDLSEVAEEVRQIAREQGRWIKIACAFPDDVGRRNRRGIEKTDWLPIDRATYDACRDLADYRPPRR